jgi:outer membrane biosynthesis protein TonB
LKRERKNRRISWALLISLGLHGIVLLWIALKPPPAGLKEAHREPIELNIVELPPPERPVEKPKPKEPEVQPPKTVEKPSEKQKPEASVASAAQPQPPTSAPAGSQKGARGTGSSSPDAPRTMTLVPGSDFPVASAGEPDGPKGHTVVNGPGEAPDAVAMNEYTGEKLTRRMNSMTEGIAGRARAGAGVVDPYFMHARSALEGDMSDGDVPKPKDKSLAREAFKGYLGTLERYGKTGNPLGEGELKDWDNYSLGRGETQGMAMQGRDSEWGGIMRQAEQSMAAQAATQRALDHAVLSAELELVQEPGGGIADSHIVKSSGYRDFDEYVLHHARKVFLKLEDPPEKGHGISPKGWRSFWRFSYFPPSVAERRGQRVRVELLRVETGSGSGNPLEHLEPE